MVGTKKRLPHPLRSKGWEGNTLHEPKLEEVRSTSRVEAPAFRPVKEAKFGRAFRPGLFQSCNPPKYEEQNFSTISTCQEAIDKIPLNSFILKTKNAAKLDMLFRAIG